ncbi:hypothetical protein BD413DRAFT_468243 [Trametes elegans]|nr:hypothetical protein BD413DRAFT_468243 [Trametes elegans]
MACTVDTVITHTPRERPQGMGFHRLWVRAPMHKINENVWVFFRAWVWGMGYDRIMGYGVDFPLYQLGNTINLWVITGYGLSQVWVKTVSTV